MYEIISKDFLFPISLPKNRKKMQGSSSASEQEPLCWCWLPVGKAPCAPGGRACVPRRLRSWPGPAGAPILRGAARAGSAPWRPPGPAAGLAAVGPSARRLLARGEEPRGAAACDAAAWTAAGEKWGGGWGGGSGSGWKNNPGGGLQTMANKTGKRQ